MSESSILARRPGFGTAGQQISVHSNSFLMRFNKNTRCFHYDVAITPDIPRAFKRGIINKLTSQHRPAFRTPPVFDGDNSLYSVTEIQQDEFNVKLDPVNEFGEKRRKTEFRVILKEASRSDFELLNEYLLGRRGSCPQEVLQVLELVLREYFSNKVKEYFAGGRSLYSDKLEKKDIGGGVEAWKGFYMSIRPVQGGMLALTIDMKANAFVKEQKVVDFLANALRLDPRDLDRHLSRQDAQGDSFRAKIKKILKGMKVETVHSQSLNRFKVMNLTRTPARSLTFEKEGAKTSLVDYFRSQYNITLQYQGFPALDMSKGERKKYIPLELCRIVKGQNYTRRINEAQYNILSKMSCCSPEIRKNAALTSVTNVKQVAGMYMRNFGVEINSNLTEVPARVLRPPKIQYGNGEVCPNNGNWNMVNKRMLKGLGVTHWGIISCANRVGEADLQKISAELSKSCSLYGMGIQNKLAFQPMQLSTPQRLESAIKDTVKELAEKRNIKLELIVCVLPSSDNKAFYSTIKRLCELELGIVTQCAKEDKIESCKPPYLANLILKINAKLGGTNSIISVQDQKKCKLISESPTMVIGADVSHPRPGDDTGCSMAAVVGSMNWPEFSQYKTVVRSQAMRQEMVDDLFWEQVDEQGRKTTGGIFKEMLEAFHNRTNLVPKRIMYYRDGVSDGQFEAVLKSEYESLQRACRALGWIDGGSDEAEPAQKRSRVPGGVKITFIVVQKRHHTCFFPSTPQQGRDQNIKPGTIVDKKICHPSNFDFFLCSHQGIKGTSRPVHYHVLKDENEFSADEIQQFTHDMCYLYNRCTRSVSVVPPCYYAHLAAQRAQTWVDPEGSSGQGSSIAGGGSESGAPSAAAGRRGRRGVAPGPVRPLPPLHDNIKNSMFYI